LMSNFLTRYLNFLTGINGHFDFWSIWPVSHLASAVVWFSHSRMKSTGSYNAVQPRHSKANLSDAAIASDWIILNWCSRGGSFTSANLAVLSGH
jgi:hypothetical protein